MAILGGYVINTPPKLKGVSESLQVDVREKFGPLSALQLTLRRCQKIFGFWGLTPKPEVVFAFFLFDFVDPYQMSYMAKKRSLYRAWLTRRLKGGKNCKMAIFGGYVMSTLPKLREMLGGLQVDVRAKFG